MLSTCSHCSACARGAVHASDSHPVASVYALSIASHTSCSLGGMAICPWPSSGHSKRSSNGSSKGLFPPLSMLLLCCMGCQRWAGSAGGCRRASLSSLHMAFLGFGACAASPSTCLHCSACTQGVVHDSASRPVVSCRILQQASSLRAFLSHCASSCHWSKRPCQRAYLAAASCCDCSRKEFQSALLSIIPSSLACP